MLSNVHAQELSTLVLNTQAQSDLGRAHAFRMDTSARKILASNVKRLRARKGWSQSDLATKSGIAQTAVSYCERPDGKSPTLDTLIGLAGAFGVPVWSLLVETDDLDPTRINTLNGIVQTYARLPADSQDQVSRVAEAESRYSKTV